MPALSNITVFLISQICYTFFYYYCAILIYFNVRSTHFMLFSSYILSNSVPCSVQYVHMSVSLLINNFNNDLVDVHIFSRLFNIMRICVSLFLGIHTSVCLFLLSCILYSLLKLGVHNGTRSLL